MLKEITTCPLAACYRASKYPQRPSLPKSLGTVVHKGHEQLASAAREWPDDRSEAEFRRLATELFDQKLAQEREAVEDGARVVRIVWDSDRVRDARSAFILSAPHFLSGYRRAGTSAAVLRERTIR